MSGQLKQLSLSESSHQWYLFWSQPATCEVYKKCGPFGICNEDSREFCDCLPEFEPASPDNWNLGDRGCMRKEDLQCGNSTHAMGEKDRFLRVSNVRLPDDPLTVLSARSAKECKSACLNNCSCSAYAYNRKTCTVWGGDLLNVQQLSDDDSVGQDFYLKFAASKLNGRGNKIREWL